MGIFDGVSKDIETKAFFEEVLAGAFEREIGKAAISGMEGTVFKVIFNVEGTPHGLTIKDARELEVTAGGVEEPDMEIALSEAGWRTAVSGDLGNALDIFTDFTKLADRGWYDTVKGTKGKVNLVIELPEGDRFTAQAKLGDADTPEVTITAGLGVWQEIIAGTTQAAMAYMGGKLKLAGDMALAMQLNGLM